MLKLTYCGLLRLSLLLRRTTPLAIPILQARTTLKTRKSPRKRQKVFIFSYSICARQIYTNYGKDDSDSSSNTSSDEESEEEEKPKVTTKKSKKDDAMDVDKEDTKDVKKRKRSETTEAPVEKSEKSKKSKKEAKPASEQTGGGEQWNVQALDGGAQRQAKFLKLLGGGKKGDAANADSGAAKSKAEIAKMTSNLEKQFNQGMQAKEAGVSRRRGLGA